MFGRLLISDDRNQQAVADRRRARYLPHFNSSTSIPSMRNLAKASTILNDKCDNLAVERL
jgi:hypothetical protein